MFYGVSQPLPNIVKAQRNQYLYNPFIKSNTVMGLILVSKNIYRHVPARCHLIRAEETLDPKISTYCFFHLMLTKLGLHGLLGKKSHNIFIASL